jgi:hypothetical protein
VTWESTGCSNKQKMLAKTKGYQALAAIDKCIQEYNLKEITKIVKDM